jgi:hypothetical protein
MLAAERIAISPVSPAGKVAVALAEDGELDDRPVRRPVEAGLSA